MSKRSRARKNERIITVSTDGQEPFTVRIDNKNPATAIIVALPDTTALTRARAALNAAVSELRGLNERQRERVLEDFGLYEDDIELFTLPNGREVYCSGLKAPDPTTIISESSNFHKEVARFLMGEDE